MDVGIRVKGRGFDNSALKILCKLSSPEQY